MAFWFWTSKNLVVSTYRSVLCACVGLFVWVTSPSTFFLCVWVVFFFSLVWSLHQYVRKYVSILTLAAAVAAVAAVAVAAVCCFVVLLLLFFCLFWRNTQTTRIGGVCRWVFGQSF